MDVLLNQVIDIAKIAGDAIMKIYETDFERYEKSDSSPLTEADLAAHHIIIDGLKKISDFPCLSEESDQSEIEWEQRKNWNEFWIIDPLDGTKEFINRNDEFTVNIALVKNGKAVLGVVYCPALQTLYYAEESSGSFKKYLGSDPVPLQVCSSPVSGESWKVVGSRRHGAEALEEFSKVLGNVELVSMGSSLKLCLVAEGKAHLYPRLAPTCEWDTAAAQAVVEIAGGQVLTPDMVPLVYGQKSDLLNPYFIVCGGEVDSWSSTFTELATA